MVKFLALTSLFSFIWGGIPQQNTSNNITDSSIVPYSHYSHPEIKGFSYSYGFKDKVLATEPTGYFYYHSDIYFTQFTEVSRLYIFRVAAEFTSGRMANLNGDKSYDWNYRNDSGYIHSSLKQVVDGSKRSSTIHPITKWPVSEGTSIVNISTNFGVSLSLNNEIKAGVNLTDGISVSKTTSNSLTLSFGESVTVTKNNPTVSTQYDPKNPNEAQWRFQYAKPEENTYFLETYNLFEVKNDGYGYQDYSFGYEYDIKLTGSAWEGYLWHQLRDTTAKDTNGAYGLY